MKKRILGLSLTISLLFASCNARENIVTFYLDNEISKELVLDATIGESGSGLVFSEKNLDLLESETFRRYFLNIVELEVTSLSFTISDYDQGVDNPTLSIGNSIEINDLQMVNGSFQVNDNRALQRLSDELLSQLIIPFSFEGNAVSEDSFNVSVSISLKGVFTD